MDWRIALVTIWTALALPGAASAAERAEIPIKQIVLPDGMIRYSIMIDVGGAPVEATLDSGSTGLRLLPHAVPDAALDKISAQSTYSYASGVEVKGPFAKARVTIGPAATDEPIYVQAIDKIGCVPTKPDCPASRTTLADYRIAGNGIPGKGFLAIIGVGLRPGGIANPLSHMGDGAWIITLPKPGSSNPGALILNPTPEERAGFALFQLARAHAQTPVGAIDGWQDNIPACLIDADAKHQACGVGVLDTGAPGVTVRSRRLADRNGWLPGERGAIAFAVNGQPLVSNAFLINRQPGGHVAGAEPKGQEEERLMLGTLPYYSFSVLYDLKAGTMGLKKRTD